MAASSVGEVMANMAANRAPGKRRVKVRENLLDFADFADDDDDEDYHGGKASENDGESGDEAAESADDDDDDDDDDSNQSDESTSGGDAAVEESNDASTCGAASSSTAAAEPLCSLCLNLRPLDGDENEVMSCDRCGLSVHEACYGRDVDEGDTAAESDGSDATSEPWFCEPCLSGLECPPFCELCPSRIGAFKRTDAGRWVHLLCALYTKDVTFADTEHLSAVSLFEMAYQNYGNRSCGGCEERVQARTGVCTECEAALCRTYYHVTCAHSLGLLVDVSSTHATDPRYICCPTHSDQSEMKLKRKRWREWEAQETRRMVALRRKELDERERAKLLGRRRAFERRFKQLDLWLPHVRGGRAGGECSGGAQAEQRWARLPGSSAELVERLRRKAVAAGLQDERPNEDAQCRVDDPSALRNLSAAFSVDFVRYYVERNERTIPQAKEHEAALKVRLDALRIEQAALEKRCAELEEESARLTDEAKADHCQLTSLAEALRHLGCKTAKSPPKLKLHSPVRVASPTCRSPVASCSNSEPTSKGGSRRRATTPPPQQLKRRRSMASALPSPARLTRRVCATCFKAHEQHMLAHCDTCAQWFHLACLDPPLAKMPKKTGIYGWECSQCAQKSSDDDDDADVDVLAPRRLRQRAPLPSLAKYDSIGFTEAAAAESEGVAVKRRGRPPSPGRHEAGGDEADHSAASFGSPPLDDALVLNVSTSRRKLRRMQYPQCKLNDAVAAVLKGRMNAHRAAQFYGVPRSTIGRRISLSQGKLPRPKREREPVAIASDSARHADDDDEATAAVNALLPGVSVEQLGDPLERSAGDDDDDEPVDIQQVEEAELLVTADAAIDGDAEGTAQVAAAGARTRHRGKARVKTIRVEDLDL